MSAQLVRTKTINLVVRLFPLLLFNMGMLFGLVSHILLTQLENEGSNPLLAEECDGGDCNACMHLFLSAHFSVILFSFVMLMDMVLLFRTFRRRVKPFIIVDKAEYLEYMQAWEALTAMQNKAVKNIEKDDIETV